MKNLNRVFDWSPLHDERSRNYSISSLVHNVKPRKVMWQEGIVLDQGNEGACVGFGWMAEVLAEPASPDLQPSESFANQLAFKYYDLAKKADDWPGEDYEGTSVLAGAKVMKAEGFIQSYRWCFSVEQVRDAIIAEGPVVIGIPWRQNMYSTGSNGVVKVSGAVVGGHCLTITGYDPAMKIGNKTYEVFRWRNSWGKDYGVDGSGYIKYTDLAKLLADNGEACVPIGRLKPVFKQNWLRTLFNRFLTTE